MLWTDADRDAKKRWASGMAANNLLGGFTGVGGQIVSGLGRAAIGKMFS